MTATAFRRPRALAYGRRLGSRYLGLCFSFGLILSGCNRSDTGVSTPDAASPRAGSTESSNTSDPSGAAPNAEELEIDLPEFGFSMRYPSSWAPSTLTTLPTTRPTTRPEGTPPKTLAELRRRPEARGFRVVPRVIVTIEPSKVAELDAAVGLVLSDVAQVAQAPGTRLGRTEVGRRKLSSMNVATLETSYAVGQAPAAGAKRAGAAEADSATEIVVQRSVLALVADLRKKPQLLTVTATYLMRDAPIVGDEVSAMLGAIRLEPVAEPTHAREDLKQPRRPSRPPNKGSL